MRAVWGRALGRAGLECCVAVLLLCRTATHIASTEHESPTPRFAHTSWRYVPDDFACAILCGASCIWSYCGRAGLECCVAILLFFRAATHITCTEHESPTPRFAHTSWRYVPDDFACVISCGASCFGSCCGRAGLECCVAILLFFRAASHITCTEFESPTPRSAHTSWRYVPDDFFMCDFVWCELFRVVLWSGGSRMLCHN